MDRQEYISWKLPKDWHILLTANPDDGEYLVQTTDIAQKTRYISAIMKFDKHSWAEWAERNNIDGRCINFVLMNDEVITKKVNPRSITTFFNSISSFKNFNQHLPMIQMVGEGSIGPDAATLFTTFINNNLDQLITPEKMLLGTDTASVIDSLRTTLGQGNDYRNDIGSLLATRLINFSLAYAEENKIEPKHVERIMDLVKAEGVFVSDVKYHVIKKIINGNKKKFGMLLRDVEIQEWAMK